MAEQPPHRDAFLALGGKLGPVVGDRRVEVELAFLSQDVRGHGHHAFGGGPDHLQRVGGVRLRPTRRGYAAPEVHHALSVEVYGAGRADLAVLLEVGGERLPHRLETGRHRPADLRLDHFAKSVLPTARSEVGCPPLLKANYHIVVAGGTGAWLRDGVPPTSRGGMKLVPRMVRPLF